MNATTLQAFRDLHEAMQTEPQDWQWIGQHMSQRMFGITRTRAEEYAKRYGGTAQPMQTTHPRGAHEWVTIGDWQMCNVCNTKVRIAE